jgi:signal peptidase II
MKKSYLILGIVLALVVAVLDQWSKWWAFDFLIKNQTTYMPIFPGFNLVMVLNYGVSFGMFSNLPAGAWILSGVTIAIMIYLLYWLSQVKTYWMGIAIGLIIGGAIGNLIDRVRVGAVADFLDFYIADYHWPAFNVSDSCVFIGVMMLLWDSFFIKSEAAEKKE